MTLVLLAFLAACGGGGSGGSSPSAPQGAPAPTPAPPPVFEVVDGINNRKFIPESVVPADPQVGQSVTVTQDGYLTREQRWDGTPIALWPWRSEEDLLAIQDLVYGPNSRPLRKWAEASVDARLEVVGDVWADEIPTIREALRQTFDEVAALGAPAFSWERDSAGLEVARGSSLRVIVDRHAECIEEQYVACAEYWKEGSTITRAELTFDSPEMVRNLRIRRFVVGFILGLSPLDLKGMAMNPGYHNRGDSFHELERRVIRMVYVHRNPGNRQPDRDPSFASSGTPDGGRETLVDRGPGR